ncbi:MAG: hypothetical protein NZ695_07250 [Dehalococcoidia bacterium]|jgi:chromosome segregation ATPase|nr:hypothetical protein [Dehalococcoidia bacterium]MDW8009318.1 hypothetical protein [Chloroflexota bacterium]
MIEAGATAGDETYRQRGDGRLLLAQQQAPLGSQGPGELASQLEEAVSAVRTLLNRLDAEIAKARRSLEELEGLRTRVLSQLRDVAEARITPWGGPDPVGR